MVFYSGMAHAVCGFSDPKKTRLFAGLLLSGAAFALAAAVLWQPGREEREESAERGEASDRFLQSEGSGGVAPDVNLQVLNLKVQGAEICGLSHLGKVRSNNQDSFRITPLPELGSDYALLLVCDGMGGHVGGEVASSIAANLIANAVSKLGSREPKDMYDGLRDALQRADAAIEQRASKERDLDGMGTTAVAAIIWQEGFVHAYIGDSRLYQIEGEKISYMTRDHSVVRLLLEEGIITEAEAKDHPFRSQLTSSLGGGKDSNRLTIEPKWTDEESPFRRWRDGSSILLCSDGLNSELSNEEIKDVVLNSSGSAQGANRLLQSTLSTEARDNVTVILAHRL